MEWTNRMNQVINYIEEHITEEIDYKELAEIACCSVYHFQRMFAYIAGVSLSEYIRRRRMSLAAVDLQSGDEKIIDIGLKYGYSSPTAFNRAFQSVHGIAPSAVKNEGVSVKSFPPFSFKFEVEGGKEMNYRIETKEAFRIVGKSWPLNKEIEQNFLEVPQMWQEATGRTAAIPTDVSGGYMCLRLQTRPSPCPQYLYFTEQAEAPMRSQTAPAGPMWLRSTAS